MGMSGYFFQEFDKILDAYVAGAIDLDECREKLRAMGFEPPDIDGHLEALEDRDESR